jgi:hypothetical protein
MKSICCILFFLLLFFVTSAQERQSLRLTIGPSIPVGAFGGQDGLTTADGLAYLGGLVDLSYDLRFGHSAFGFIATGRVRLNPINGTASLARIERLDTGYNMSVSKRSWVTGAVFAGISHQWSPGGKWMVFESVEAGVAEAILPSSSFTGLRNSVAYPGSQDYLVGNSKKVTSVAPTGLFKFGARYPLTHHFFFLAYLDFWYLRAKMNTISYFAANTQGLNVPGVYTLANSKGLTQALTYGYDYTQEMNSVDLGLGLAFRF